MGMAYAQQGAPSGGALVGPVQLLVPVLIFVVFYFLMFRPQQKKQRQQKEMLGNMKIGDRILTTGGLYGTIVRFGEDNRVKIKIAENVTVEIAKGAITEKVAGLTEGAKGKGDSGSD